LTFASSTGHSFMAIMCVAYNMWNVYIILYYIILYTHY
jgi:hypothetical protein